MNTKTLLKEMGLIILLIVMTSCWVKAQIPIQGLESENEGVVSWDADGSGPEPQAYGHPMPFGWGSSMYYTASRDYVEKNPDCAMAHFQDDISGFPLFVQALSDNGFTKDQVKIKYGLTKQLDDIEGEDWFNIENTHYFNRYNGSISIELNGEPMISAFVNFNNIRNVSSSPAWKSETNFTTPFNISAGSSMAVQDLADAFMADMEGCHTATQQLSDDQMNMRLILASNDPVAIDAISALLTGHDPQLTTHLVALHNDTMGCCDARLIRVNGVKTGDKKNDFLCWGTGVLTKYDDFDPPWFTTDECYIVGDQLYLSLDTDTSVTKVDVMVDSTYLNQIVIGKFDEIYLDLDTLQINTGSQIIVYAYDKYLNFSEEELIATLSPELKISAHNDLSVSVAPNPCSETAFLRFKTEDQGFVISNLYAVSGRLIKRLMNKELPAGTHEIEVDMSDLQEGVYFMRVLAGNESAVRKLVVVH